MKWMMGFSLCLVSILSHAATLVLDYPVGLQNGERNIDCTFRYVYGGPSHIHDQGKNTSQMPQYGLPASISRFNTLINDAQTTDITLNIQLICQNQKTINYHFNND